MSSSLSTARDFAAGVAAPHTVAIRDRASHGQRDHGLRRRSVHTPARHGVTHNDSGGSILLTM